MVSSELGAWGLGLTPASVSSGSKGSGPSSVGWWGFGWGGIWAKGRVAPRLHAGHVRVWEEALPSELTLLFLSLAPGGAAAPGRALQVQQAKPVLQLSHQPLVASLQTALTTGPPQTQCLGLQGPQGSQTKAGAATGPIKCIPDATASVSAVSSWGVGVRSCLG